VTSRVLHPSAVPALLADLDDAGFARAAVFDADGTLWAGDIGDAAFVQSARAGLVSDAMYEGPLAAWASRTGLSLPTDKVEGIAHIVSAHEDGTLRARGLARGLDEDGWRRDYYEMQAWIYADQPRDAVVDFGRRLMEGGLADGIFASMVQLLRALEHSGVAVHLASASHAALVEAGAVFLGVPAARVAGMEPTPGLSTTMQARTYGDDKRDTARARLGAPPLLAFGDSVLFTDRALLQSAKQPFAVATRGAHREAAVTDARLILVDP
jgi:phosphatidylglycerophosphatase C